MIFWLSSLFTNLFHNIFSISFLTTEMGVSKAGSRHESQHAAFFGHLVFRPFVGIFHRNSLVPLAGAASTSTDTTSECCTRRQGQRCLAPGALGCLLHRPHGCGAPGAEASRRAGDGRGGAQQGEGQTLRGVAWNSMVYWRCNGIWWSVGSGRCGCCICRSPNRASCSLDSEGFESWKTCVVGEAGGLVHRWSGWDSANDDQNWKGGVWRSASSISSHCTKVQRIDEWLWDVNILIFLCFLFAVRMYLRSVCPSNPLVFWQYSIYSISIHNNFDRVYSFIMRHTLLNTTLRVAFAWQVLDHLLRILGIGSSKRRLQVVDVSPLSSTQVTTDMMGFGLSPFDDVCFFF